MLKNAGESASLRNSQRRANGTPPCAASRLDLGDIWHYIAAKSGSADIADRLVDSITDRFFLMANHPYLGRARDDLRPGLRSFPVAEYVIICPFVRDSCNRLEYTGRVNLRKRSP